MFQDVSGLLSLPLAAVGSIRTLQYCHICTAGKPVPPSCPPHWAWQGFWLLCHPVELGPWWAAEVEQAAVLGTRQRRVLRSAGRGCGEEASGSGAMQLQSPPAAG